MHLIQILLNMKEKYIIYFSLDKQIKYILINSLKRNMNLNTTILNL